MFCVVYQFEVKENSKEQFIRSWKDLTNMFIVHAGSLGSRLHQSKGDILVAYAQWPDESTWRLAGGRLPESAQELRETMRQSCE
ncbi:MAG: antibiotic biosynthesis monooxygenase, partial [Cryomorphaceae bacterium]